ncbi:MAG: class I SAM-dependent methyltransferase [Candidatus Bipolaricaulota bacterium]|nr:class I SAM-dependent methyltransferase [Candidatus Bipolaricaulota bacterium]
MLQDNPFDAHADEYDAWFDRFPNLYESELLAVRAILPPRRGRWVEIGVGSGRFASRLGIDLGIEPSEAMARLARARGVKVLAGCAEEIPLEEASVRAAFLITTVCFLSDLPHAFAEVRRILRRDGAAVIAFIPRDSRFGRLYRENANGDTFFSHAQLRSTNEVTEALTEAGFHVDRILQTLTGDPATADARVEVPSSGSDRGSFVVVRGRTSGSRPA